jgi:copper chaperone CopZ
MNNIKLYVEAMNCGGCVSSIQDALDAVNGVQAVKVDLGSKSVSLITEKSLEQIKLILSEAGYESVEAVE